MAHKPAPSASVDPGGPDHQVGSDLKEIYRNLGMEISSLPYMAKCDKVRDFLRSNANAVVDIQELADQTNFVSSRTISRWVLQIHRSAQVQPLFPAVAAQGMTHNSTKSFENFPPHLHHKIYRMKNKFSGFPGFNLF